MVYLPGTSYLHWNVSKYEDRSAVKVLPAGDHYIAAPLGTTPLFVRENTLLPLAEPGRNSDSFGTGLVVLGLVTDQASFTLHWDDGVSKSLKDKCQLKLNVQNKDGQISCLVETLTGNVKSLPWKQVAFEVYDLSGKVQRVTKEIL
jgi:alpha-glucosidase (family GH31 glycosyl hydrolase)